MPPESQVKLLRVLETGTHHARGRRAGDQDVDVRVVAATNRDPESGRRGRQAARRPALPPERRSRSRCRRCASASEDIELLADHFLVPSSSESTRRRSGCAKERASFLHAHPWQGNVRELKNAVQRAFILAEEEITPDCLPPEIHARPAAQSGEGLFLKVGASLAENERRLILATLEHVEGSKRKAAELLGISLKTLYTRLSSYQAKSGLPQDEIPKSASDPVRRTS